MDDMESDCLLLSNALSDARESHPLLLFCRASVHFQLGRYHSALCDASAALELQDDLSLSIEARSQCSSIKAEAGARMRDASGQHVPLRTVQQRTRRFDVSSMVPKGLRSDSHIFGSSADGKETNLLLLLHGLGDGPRPFHNLAVQMKLPQTSTLSLAGPLDIPLLEDGGKAWFQAFDEEFNLIKPTRGEKRRVQSLNQTVALLTELIESAVEAGGYQHREIHLLGFSQGGSCALELHSRFRGSRRLGGCISISGPVLPEAIWASSTKADDQEVLGPALITVGEREPRAARAEMDETVEWLREKHRGNVRLFVVNGKGHSMVSSKLEMTELMAFWAETLSKDLSDPQAGIFEVSSKT